MPSTLVLATRNPHKLREIGEIVGPFGVIVRPASELGLGEVEETGTTFADNAVLKAAAGLAHTGLPCLADDSGLMVDALDGRPGVYSARFAGPEATDADNNARLIAELAGVPDDQRGAGYVCAMALALPADVASKVSTGPWDTRPLDASPGAVALVVEGGVRGRIGDVPRGAGGFGYDPFFVFPPDGCTMAELTAARKHAISHRGAALQQLGGAWTQIYGAKTR